MRVIEAYPLSFTNGGTSTPLYGNYVTGQTSGATGRINGTPILSSGAWSTSNAAGTLTLSNVIGTFSNGENLTIGGTYVAKASTTLGSKTNFIRAYYGHNQTDHSPDATAENNARKAYPRITGDEEAYWPVDDISSWASANDYFTLVACWDAVNTGITRKGTGSN